MAKGKYFELRFGALAPSIREQLRTMGIKVTSARAAIWQEVARSLLVLRFGGFISDSQQSRGERRLTNHISKQLVKDGKLERKS